MLRRVRYSVHMFIVLAFYVAVTLGAGTLIQDRCPDMSTVVVLKVSALWPVALAMRLGTLAFDPVAAIEPTGRVYRCGEEDK